MIIATAKHSLMQYMQPKGAYIWQAIMPLHELGSAWPCETKQGHCRVLFSSEVSLQWCMGVKYLCINVMSLDH